MTYSIRTIVAGVAELDSAEPVLSYALELADRLKVSLYLVHAFQPPTYWGAGMDAAAIATPTIIPTMESAQLESVLLERLKALIPASLTGAPITARVVLGPADLSLADVADEVSADLLLVGATRRHGFGRVFLGTTAGRTLRRAKVPVLVLRAPPRHPGARVLLSTDLSDLSARALRLGIKTTQALFGHETLEFRCLLVTGLGVGDLPPAGVEELRAQASGALRQFTESLNTEITIREVVRVGAPLDEIVAEAADWPADLVVIGTHGRSGISRLFLGSIAEAAVRDLPCSVLVVPAEAVGVSISGD